MRGLLYRSEGKWFVMNTQATLNGPLIQSIPLLPSDVKNVEKYDCVLDGEEINFEVVDYSQRCKECKEIVERGRSCSKGCFMKPGNFISTEKLEYAKICNPPY